MLFGGKIKTIVIIEDEKILADALNDLLTDKGYKVITSQTGEEGIKIIKAENPALLLLDTLLPGIDGLEVLEKLKEYREKHKLPVIVLSNVDDPVELMKARAYTIAEYMIKTDWKINEVLRAVKKHI